MIESVVNIFTLSGCFWIIYLFYMIFKVKKFIVKRYELETNILDTIAFKEHAAFTRHLPAFFSSALYTSHLTMCLWGWRLYKNRKVFRDIDDPAIITRHFSKKEINLVKWYGISGLMFAIHIIIFYTLKLFWPELL